MIALRRPLAAACVALLAACGGDGTGPVAGSLKVNFTTPNNGHDAAVLLLLTAPAPPAGATAAAGLSVWGTPFTSTTTKLVVTGTLSTGTILSIQVDDVNRVGQYSVSVQVVSADSTVIPRYALRPMSGYSASITK